MEKQKPNITYLLGAGASYFSCPIWKMQGEKMIELAKKYLPEEKQNFEIINHPNLTEQEALLWDIGFFGTKAQTYGTVDTYAKKLKLSNDYERQLSRLKLAVSVFFYLWESTNDEIKNGFEDIDHRYITLLASLLTSENKDPKLLKNIRFVSWNYDLQLERAFKSFCMDHLKWDYVSKILNFRIPNENPLQLCHLNGYNGFYMLSKDKEGDIMDRTSFRNVLNILDEIGFVGNSQKRESLSFNQH